MSDSIASQSKNTWLFAEQTFMRFIGMSLLVIAILGLFIGIFPDSGEISFVSGMNIVTAILLAIGGIWSLWWANDMKRIETLVAGFQRKGNGRTYAAAVVQALVGILFSFELFSGNWALGLIGIVMLIGAVFFVWRAMQISRYNSSL